MLCCTMDQSARMPGPERKPKVLMSVGLGIALATALTIALAAFLFDWDWLRPSLERYLSAKSGREVRAEHMAVNGLFTLEPTITFRGATIQNAAWADTRQPMAAAGEASFVVSLQSLFTDRTVVSKIVLKDADIDLEKEADGRRNWRLKEPEDRGAPKVSVLRLEAHRIKLRILDRHPERDFDIRFTAKDAGPQSGPGISAKPLVNLVEAQGVYRGAPFTGQALTSAVLTFRETREFFAVRGHAVGKDTRIEMDGEAADIFQRPMLDATVRLAGPTLANLHPYLLVQPANSRPYRFEGRVRRSASEYLVTRLSGHIGQTDLEGDASHALKDGRHSWGADLKSGSADLHDLGTLVGIPYPVKPAHPDKLFPQRPIKTDRLRAQDVQVRLDAKKIATPGMPALEGLRFEANLQQGVLQVKGVDMRIAGGHASGQATLDARNDVPRGQTALKLSGLRLERLLPKLPEEAHKAGPVHGTVSLEGAGPSIAGMMAAAAGRLDLAVDGGSLSNKTDAKLSLNLGKLAGLMFKGDRDIPIRCALAGFDFSGGKGRARALLFETEQTRIEGAGVLDLRAEHPDLVLIPKPKTRGLLTLGSSIRVGGTFKHPDVEFHKGTSDAPAVSSNAQCPAKGASLTADAGGR